MSNLHASTLLPRSHPSLHTSLHLTLHLTSLLTSLPSPRVLLRSHPTVLRLDVATRSVPRSLSSTVAAMLSRSLRAVVVTGAHSRSPLRSHFICTASRPAVRAAVVMRPAHASADRGRRRSRRRDQVRTRFASARAALLSMAGGNAAATRRVGSDRSSARCGRATPRSDRHSISTLHSMTHTSMTSACRSC